MGFFDFLSSKKGKTEEQRYIENVKGSKPNLDFVRTYEINNPGARERVLGEPSFSYSLAAPQPSALPPPPAAPPPVPTLAAPAVAAAVEATRAPRTGRASTIANRGGVQGLDDTKLITKRRTLLG